MENVTVRQVVWSTLIVCIALPGGYWIHKDMQRGRRKRVIVNTMMVISYLRTQFATAGKYPEDLKGTGSAFPSVVVDRVVRYERCDDEHICILLYTFKQKDNALLDQMHNLPIEKYITTYPELRRFRDLPEEIYGIVFLYQDEHSFNAIALAADHGNNGDRTRPIGN